MPVEKLIDIKLTPEEKQEKKETAMAPEPEQFPFGLRNHLEEETIEKLGLEKLPIPGEKRLVYAEVRIESASMTKDDNGTRRSLSWQIIKLGISGAGENIEEESERVDKNKGGPPRPSPEEVLFTS